MVNRFAALSDEGLLIQLQRFFEEEHRVTARLIACLAEFDRRRLYLAQGYSSLYGFCIERYRLSEYAAYNRIEAARAANRFPVVLDMLESGELSLTAVSLLARHLTEPNHQDVLVEARHKTAREVERIVARLKPRPDVPSSIRKTPVSKTPVAELAAASVADGLRFEEDAPAAQAINATVVPATALLSALPPSTSRAVIKPLAPETYKVQFTISRQAHDKLRRTQDLMRHSLPDGDVAVIFEKALTLLLSDLERRKFALVSRPRSGVAKQATSGSRQIPASVRREVSARDAGRCAFVGAVGRCTETGSLEFHHVVPYAAGGLATVENIELRCRAHNAHEADLYFGPQRGP